MQVKPFVVGIGGTLRVGSSSEQALALALRYAAEKGAETCLIAGSSLVMPHYDPQVGCGCAEARRLCAMLRRADGIIISSPCYHGAISGLIKNALDYTEELRNDERPYFDGRAVGGICCGSGSQGPSMALTEMRAIIHALRGWPVPLGVAINVAQAKWKDGRCSDPVAEKQIEVMAAQVVSFACLIRAQAERIPAVFAG
ncbi:MAG TPA: NAD(P)H-dependent oxidoreductase [Xanthobacteraceae bacterium]|nr:NAD(P)H-dependent oxidoreductase [Xanthobacteraceae bacterium]